MINTNVTWPRKGFTSTLDGELLLTKAGYRKDIDGLRAIAVLLVIFYHVFGEQGIVPGGFIGVDVFFVISGYLISQHVVSELKAGTFSLKAFYLRRMRRILPASIFIVTVVCLVGFFILVPDDFKKLSESALSACLSTSNIYFWKHLPMSYFHSDASVVPLLHTWSLSVEEQFYIFWPLTLCFLFNRYPRAIGPATLFFALLSFASYFYLRIHPNFTFYCPITRGFELLIGGSLAIYWTRSAALSSRKSLLLSAAGLGLIIYLSSYLNQFHTIIVIQLLACFATALLIYSGKRTDNVIYKLLTLNILTFLTHFICGIGLLLHSSIILVWRLMKKWVCLFFSCHSFYHLYHGDLLKSRLEKNINLDLKRPFSYLCLFQHYWQECWL